MTKDISKKNHKKTVRTIIILIGSLIVLTVLTIVAFAIPASVTTGEEKYTGAQLAAVQYALDIDQGAYSPAAFHGATKQHIESVVPITDFKDTDSDLVSKCTTDPDNKDYYVVTIRRVWLFGSTYGIRDYNNCDIHVYKKY